jgi:DEAD/DEAH box helicase domain-containing protein
MSLIVLDLETKRSFEEVGGAHNRAQLGVSVVGVYHYDEDRYACYREEAFEALAGHLKAAARVIGFNITGFDLPVLASVMGDWVCELPTLDLMLEAQKALGHRVSLDALAQATLGMSTTAWRTSSSPRRFTSTPKSTGSFSTLRASAAAPSP